MKNKLGYIALVISIIAGIICIYVAMVQEVQGRRIEKDKWDAAHSISQTESDYSDDPEMDSVTIIPTTILEHQGKRINQDNIIEIGTDYIAINGEELKGEFDTFEFKDGKDEITRTFTVYNKPMTIEVHGNAAFVFYYEDGEVIDIVGYVNQ